MYAVNKIIKIIELFSAIKGTGARLRTFFTPIPLLILIYCPHSVAFKASSTTSG
ncbi:hypothetical protein D1BOALGB6SA_7822 [Olavius sp. associated proteobacterium Delta 1]|nr:hypothetical protein D1BOALGB6SA_7822 [Olavius sp. associated proteobacterium Delta 1]